MTASATPLSPEVVSLSGNTMVLSMGPQHPSTHGVLQIVLEIEGENVVKAEPEIGYLHTGIDQTILGLFKDAQRVIESANVAPPPPLRLDSGLPQVLGGYWDRRTNTWIPSGR